MINANENMMEIADYIESYENEYNKEMKEYLNNKIEVETNEILPF